MADSDPDRSLKRVWIGALVLIVIFWIIYALSGGESVPKPETGSVPSAPSR